MHQVTKIIHFCYGHRLLNYEGKCRHLHGHNGKVEIQLSRETLDSRGMVVDFDEITQVVQTWINTELDHKMLLNRADPILPVLQQLGEPVYILDANPTAESMARLIYEFAASRKLPVTAVRLWETDASFASYRPSPPAA